MAVYNKGKYFGVGVENWIVIMSILTAVNVAMGNWKNQSFTNFVYPKEFLQLFYEFLNNYGILFLTIALMSFIQTNFCLLVEKLVQNDVISEGTSQVFYLINGFTLPNLFLAYCFTSKIGAVTAFYVTGILLHLFCLKVLSYMYENTKLRRIWQNEQCKSPINSDQENSNIELRNGKEKQTINYLESVNFKNLNTFMYVSPSLVYKPNSNVRWKLDISHFIIGAVKGVIIFYIGLNILNVLIIDDVKRSASFISHGELINTIKVGIKLAIPIHLLWLLMVYYFTFCVYFESWSKAVGYPLNQDYDWWNSESVSTFWCKWNVIVHEWLKETVYKPLLTAGVSKTTAGTMVFALSGLFHTYCFELPFQLFNGFGFIAMVMQVPYQEFTNYIKKRYGMKISNCLIWLQVMVGHPIAIILMYYNFVCSQAK